MFHLLPSATHGHATRGKCLLAAVPTRHYAGDSTRHAGEPRPPLGPILNPSASPNCSFPISFVLLELGRSRAEQSRRRRRSGHPSPSRLDSARPKPPSLAPQLRCPFPSLFEPYPGRIDPSSIGRHYCPAGAPAPPSSPSFRPCSAQF